MEKKLLNLLDTCALGECCKAENCTNDIREKTRVINFSGGFNDSPEFVLITAGANII